MTTTAFGRALLASAHGQLQTMRSRSSRLRRCVPAAAPTSSCEATRYCCWTGPPCPQMPRCWASAAASATTWCGCWATGSGFSALKATRAPGWRACSTCQHPAAAYRSRRASSQAAATAPARWTSPGAAPEPTPSPGAAAMMRNAVRGGDMFHTLERELAAPPPPLAPRSCSRPGACATRAAPSTRPMTGSARAGRSRSG